MSSFQAASSLPFADLKLPSLTIATLLEAQHKNAAALGNANQAVFDGLKTLAQRQGSLLAASVDACTCVTRDVLAAQSFEDRATKQADAARDAYVSIFARFRELSDIVIGTNVTAIGIVNARVIEAFDELRALFAPPVAAPAATSEAPAAALAEPTAALEDVALEHVAAAEKASFPVEPDPETVTAAAPIAPEAAAPEAQVIAAPTTLPETAAPKPEVAAAPAPPPKSTAAPATKAAASPARTATPKTPPLRPPRRPTSRG